MIKPPYQVIELKVEPFTDIWGLSYYLFVASVTVTAMGHSRHDFSFVYKSKVPKSFQHFFLCHTQLPTLCQHTNLSFGSMILILVTLFGSVQLNMHAMSLFYKLSVLTSKLSGSVSNQHIGDSNIVGEFNKRFPCISSQGHRYHLGEFPLHKDVAHMLPCLDFIIMSKVSRYHVPVSLGQCKFKWSTCSHHIIGCTAVRMPFCVATSRVFFAISIPVLNN